jgi:hypothetical protein
MLVDIAGVVVTCDNFIASLSDTAESLKIRDKD